MNQYDSLRIDKWLWAARFFKTRSRAKEAVAGGKVHLNGNRVKPARDVRLGDRLAITQGQIEVEVLVQAIREQRGSATLAQQMYSETEDSIARRTEMKKKREVLQPDLVRSTSKPNKWEQRRLARLKRGR